MTEIKLGVQLLVEGKDQQNFFKAFIEHLSLKGIQVQNFGGVDQLSPFLKQFVKAPHFSIVKKIGIIRDAEDKSIEDVHKSIQSALESTDLPTDNDLVKVFILPDNKNEGMLETLLCKTFADTGENSCINSFFECVRKLPEISIKRYDKARAHAFLATREDPHVSVGVAAKKGYWDFNHDALADVKSFLRDLPR